MLLRQGMDYVGVLEYPANEGRSFLHNDINRITKYTVKTEVVSSFETFVTIDEAILHNIFSTPKTESGSSSETLLTVSQITW